MKTVCSLLTLLLVVGLMSCEAPLEPEFDLLDQPNDLDAAHARKNDNPFAGSWRLESAVRGDGESAIGNGSATFTFFSKGDYSVSVTNDVDHQVCGSPQTSCGWNGTYTYTATRITLDELGGPEPGEDSSGYVFCGGRLILLDEDGKLTFVRTQRNCYVKDCG